MQAIDIPHPHARKVSLFDLFLMLLAFISLIDLVFLILLGRNDPAWPLISFVDSLIALVFLGDFAARLMRSSDRSAYFFRQLGWLDLLGGIPISVAFAFQVARGIRGIRILRSIEVRQVFALLRRRLARNMLLFALVMAAMAIFLGGVSALFFEYRNPQANIHSSQDAIWWALTTVSTVGYGDRFPITTGGRIAGGLLMVIGVSIYGVGSAYLANLFLAPENQASGSLAAGDLESINTELAAMRLQLEQIQAELERLNREKPPADIAGKEHPSGG